ncbi:MAG: hypothetical protein ACKPEY_02655 [Planctomycetota bacterium]
MLGKLLAELLKELTEQESPPSRRRSPPAGPPQNRSGIPPRTATGNRPRSLDDLGEQRSREAHENSQLTRPADAGARRPRPAPDAARRAAGPAQRRRSDSANERSPPENEAVVVGIPVPESVGDHVARHLNNSSIAEHAAHLGESVTREQQQMAQHVSQSLGAGPRGNLGRGGAGEIVEARLLEPLTLAEQIAQSLSSPQQIRTAFILGEIMKRPDF